MVFQMTGNRIVKNKTTLIFVFGFFLEDVKLLENVWVKVTANHRLFRHILVDVVVSVERCEKQHFVFQVFFNDVFHRCRLAAA